MATPAWFVQNGWIVCSVACVMALAGYNMLVTHPAAGALDKRLPGRRLCQQARAVPVSFEPLRRLNRPTHPLTSLPQCRSWFLHVSFNV
jgi:hypothetical protein